MNLPTGWIYGNGVQQMYVDGNYISYSASKYIWHDQSFTPIANLSAYGLKIGNGVTSNYAIDVYSGSINLTTVLSGSQAYRVDGNIVLTGTTLGTGVKGSSLTRIGTSLALGSNNVFDNYTTLSSGVVQSSLTSVGTLTGVTVAGTIYSADLNYALYSSTGKPKMYYNGNNTGIYGDEISFSNNATVAYGNISSSGLRIGDATLSSYSLDVVGTGHFSGAVYLNNGMPIYGANIAGTANSTFLLLDNSGDNVTYLNYGAGGMYLRNNVGTGVGTMWLGATNNVGIGTTTPAYKLDVQGTGNFTGAVNVGAGASNGILIGTTIVMILSGVGNKDLAINNPTTGDIIIDTNAHTQIVCKDSNGFVGINNTTPIYQLDVNGTARFSSGVTMANTIYCADNNYALYSSANKPKMYFSGNNTGIYGDEVYFSTNATVAYANISSSGLKIGDSTLSTYPLYVNGSATVSTASGYYMVGSGTGSYSTQNQAISIYASNYIVSAVGFLAISDKRVKKNVTSLSGGLEAIRQLEPVTYKFKDSVLVGNGNKTGLLAQDVTKVLPDAINKITDFITNVYSLQNCIDFGTTGIITGVTPGLLGSTGIIRLMKTDNTPYDTDYSTEINGDIIIQNKDRVLSGITQVFVYGEQVNDFHVINYNHIYMNMLQAIKELDAKVALLENKMKH